MRSRAFIVLILLSSWLPIAGAVQALAYIAPVGLAAAAVLAGGAWISRSDFIWLFGLATFAFAFSVFYRDTGWLHAGLGLLTYSSSAILLLRFPATDRAPHSSPVRTLVVATAWLSIVEAGLGVAQLIAFQGGLPFSALDAGDNVVGTLRTNSHLFAVKMLFQGLVLAVALRASRGAPAGGYPQKLLLAGMISAFVGGLLASALLATTIFFSTVIAWGVWSVVRMTIRELVAYGALRRSRFYVTRGLPAGVVAIALVIAVAWSTQPGNVRLILRTAHGVFSGTIKVPKVEIFRTSVEEVLIADDKTAVFGLGLGRYSSRAAMILSGTYLRNHPEWIPESRTDETDRYIYPRWTRSVKQQFAGSIFGMPTSAAQSLLIEFGFAGTALVIVYLLTIGRRAARRRDAELMAGRRVEAAIAGAVPLILACIVTTSITDLWLEYASLMSFVYLVIATALSAPVDEAAPGGSEA